MRNRAAFRLWTGNCSQINWVSVQIQGPDNKYLFPVQGEKGGVSNRTGWEKVQENKVINQ